MSLASTRGILNPTEGLQHFTLGREPAPADLVGVERFWHVRWNLDGQAPFEQEILPYPCVNLSFRNGAYEVHGPGTKRFVAKLVGRSRVFGTKFHPAGFFALCRLPMRTLVDQVLTVEGVIGRAPPIPADEEPATVRAVMETFLRSFPVAADATEVATEVDRLVASAQADRNIARADDLASLAGMSVRSLHRLLEKYVGVGPKWIVRRARVQEAAERVARGESVDWARVAQDLGYHDQAHLIRDFSAQVGFTPGVYARRCAAAMAACRVS